jgi:uncharacterized protein
VPLGRFPLIRFRWIFLLCAASLAVQAATAQATPSAPEENYVKSHYTKYEYLIPMRDGVHLFTAVYVPKDSSEAYPFLVTRTPYSVEPYGEDQYPKRLGPSDEFEKAGYIFVYQDVRGRYLSEGTFVEMRPHIDLKKSPKDVDDSSDMYDTLEFLLHHVPGNNGKAGIVGISYPGFYTSASMIDSHPALKAASPQAPMTDLFMGDDTYHGGAFMLDANFGFYSSYFKPFAEPSLPQPSTSFDMGTPNHYEFYLKAGPLANLDKRYLKGSNPLFNDQLYHDTYDDYWKARDLAPHLKNVKCAVLVVGGWYDAEDLAGPYRTFNAVNQYNPETPTTLVEGPWTHGGWARKDGDQLGDIEFNAKTSDYFRKKIQFPFFEYYLKGKGAPLPKAQVFETGSNVWRTYDAWPPRNAAPKTLYFHSEGRLSFEPPSLPEKSAAYDEYISDPAHPVPFTGYITDGIPQRYMVDDQRFASTRPDVLTYETEPLTEDVTIAGPISPKLHVTTTGTDSDFDVKLIDVYPNNYPDPEHDDKRLDVPPIKMGGYQELIRGEPLRGKFRNSWEHPEPFTPGKLAEVNFIMPDLNHTFRKGHRIMVQVQSSWFPLTDRNPQTFTDIPNAKPEDFKPATERVYHSPAAASGVEVLVLPQP